MDRWFVVVLELLGLAAAAVAVFTLGGCLIKVLKEVWNS